MELTRYLDNLLESGKLQEALHVRMIKKSKIDIVYSDLINWQRSGLLYIDPNAMETDLHKIESFDFIEYVWIKIVESLRKYGFDSKEIIKYKNKFIEFIPPEALLNGALEKIDDLAIVSKEAADYIRKEKNNPSTIDFLTKKLTYLELCIIMLISYNKNCVIHFYKDTDGEFMIFSELFEDELSKNPENLKSYLNQIQKTHLSVSLNEILSQFIKVDDNGEKIFTSQLLSKDEYKIIQHIRNKSKDIKSISIKLIGGKPYRIDIKKEKKVSIESKILSLIKSKSYSKIELEIENGNIVFSCNTEKIKL